MMMSERDQFLLWSKYVFLKVMGECGQVTRQEFEWLEEETADIWHKMLSARVDPFPWLSPETRDWVEKVVGLNIRQREVDNERGREMLEGAPLVRPIYVSYYEDLHSDLLKQVELAGRRMEWEEEQRGGCGWGEKGDRE
jgi:hypothetical protein